MNPRPALHPDHGIHAPTIETPRLRPGCARRTSTIDMLRPEGLSGTLVLDGHARDLTAGPDGVLRVADTASVRGEIAFLQGRELVAVVADPAVDLAALVGLRVSSGFRQALETAVPADRMNATLRYLLLDDFPVVTLVSGYALMAGGLAAVAMPAAKRVGTPNLCAGWRENGTIMRAVLEVGMSPTVTGPEAPPLHTDDPAASGLEPLPVHGMRRHRRLDVGRGSNCYHLDSFFRDSYMGDDGVETVIHEYTVTAEVDASTLTITNAVATPRVLPWLDCPAAAASAGGLAGRMIGELRSGVRRDLVGAATCTHLNDQLRSLDDLLALARLLA